MSRPALAPASGHRGSSAASVRRLPMGSRPPGAPCFRVSRLRSCVVPRAFLQVAPGEQKRLEGTCRADQRDLKIVWCHRERAGSVGEARAKTCMQLICSGTRRAKIERRAVCRQASLEG